MDGLLTEIKSVKKVQNNIDKFETLSLEERTKSGSNSTKSKTSTVEVISSNGSDATSESFNLQPSTASSQTSISPRHAVQKHKRHDCTAFLQKSYLNEVTAASLTDDAREILKSQPDQEDLVAVLQYLQYGIDGKHDFNVHVAGPKAAQIINILVTVTIPNHWHLLRRKKLSKSDLDLKKLLLTALRSVAGIGGLSMQIRTLGVRNQNRLLVEDTMSVLDSILQGFQVLRSLLRDAHSLYQKDSQRRVFWQEVVALLCGSRVLSTAAQAAILNGDLELGDSRWLCDGEEYSAWLGKNIAACATSMGQDAEPWTLLSIATKRAMNLGYRNALISSLYSSLLLESRALWTPLKQLLACLTDHDQRVFFDGMLADLVRKYLRNPLQSQHDQSGLENQAGVGGVAAMVAGLIQGNTVLEQHIERWLTTTAGEYANLGLDTRRAVVATLGLRQDKLQKILEKSLENFGDKLQIQHSPILQQESMAEIILLTIGYLHRANPGDVRRLSKSSLFLRCVSNRLAASVPRARILGMTIAVAVSRLVDPADKVMDFGSEEMQAESVQRMLDLVNKNDEPGNVEDLRSMKGAKDLPVVEEPAEDGKQAKKASSQRQSTKLQTSKIISIEEVEDGDDEDEDLIPYGKPDDDPSDSDEDPTLINRYKPSAPVYIIDLIKQLQTDDKPEIIELALRTAPELIRRKATFGTELSDNVQVVASSLINLKDTMSDSSVQDLRLRSLIACLVSQPAIISPWLASMYFEGDFSLAQRATILTTLGLSARELSGYKDPSAPDPPSFPSKQLPPHLAAIYAPANTVARQIEHSTLQPLALAAADKLSGPDVLKVRTFSSRLEVQRKNEEKKQERSKRIPKNLHRLLADSFYLPLCCRMSLLLSSNVNIARSSIFEANIIRLFLQTLTIIIHCLGPNAIQLESVTRETLSLIVALHNIPSLALDAVVLPALLQLLLTTLDLSVEAGRTAEERLVTEFGLTMAELIRWAGGLTDGGVSVPIVEGEGTGMPWTVLVAGIQVRWHEVGRKFQGRMLGLMGGEMDEF